MRFVLGYGLNDISHMVDVAVAAEEAGFDSFTVGDSLFYPKHSDSVYPYREGDRSFLEHIPFLDPVAAIAAMVTRTTTMRFYPGVLKLPCRHPILTAKQFSSLAVMSDNRVLLGVGISPWKEALTYLGVDWEHRGRVMDECLAVIGVESTAEAVGRHYGARRGTGILDCWLVHEGDHAEIDGVAVRSVPLLMSDPKATAEMVSAGLELAGVAA